MELFAKVKSINLEMATKNDFKASKDIDKAEIIPAHEDIPWPCISYITDNVAEDALPVQAVRVPAHQV